MAPSSSHSNCSLHMVLTFDFSEIELLFCRRCLGPAIGRTNRFQDLFSTQKLHHLRQRTNSIDIDTLHHSSFRGVVNRHDKSSPISPFCFQSNRQDSLDRTQLT